MEKYISSFFLILQCLLLTACSGCSSTENKKSVTPGLEAEYLVLNEKILMNLYGSPDEKDWAVKTLEKRCEEDGDPHACYNLASHLFAIKNFSGAVRYSERAVIKSPKDALYVEMYRQSLLENGKMEIANKDSLPTNDPSYLITKLELECRNQNKEVAIQIAKDLVGKEVLTAESIRNGFISECLPEKSINELTSVSKKNKVNFASFYYSEKNKSNLFYSIWDTSYFTKNQPIEKEEDLKHQLTMSWREFRKAVQSKNDKLVRKNFHEFLKTLKDEKSQAKQEANLYLAIERAAKLLLEQDEFFAKYRSLADEI
ncbi:MAG TPA: hypothetical protein PKL30_16250 [Leptospiraceae bacterium]|nr:hypothetical protein [Leptospiraceae bacterium]HMW04700.1 hypothetical protein [Leptospiraceae bacterium]HMX31731.1 hypothetical protein [Leptospiraceae bacterium]HMY30537.1 hypothetical protein [Leptospiraceae bacterium]HMZ64162.1 hypothetical protein [Leptospiraceae bacterium]